MLDREEKKKRSLKWMREKGE